MKLCKAWVIWLAAGIFYLYEFIQRAAPSVMIPELMSEFKVSAATVGTLSALYYYAYASIQIPVGLLMDRYGTRNLLTFAASCVALGSLIFASTHNIEVAKFSRLLIGFGSAFSFVGCLKLGAHWFPAHKFAFIVGLTNLLGAIGAIIGGKPLAISIDYFGWRTSFLIIAIIGFFITLVLYKVIQDYNPLITPNNENTKSFLQGLKEIVKSKQIWLLSIFGSCMVAPIAAYSEIWGVTALMQMHHIERPLAAEISSLTFLGIAIGAPCFGLFSDYVKSRKIPMLIGVSGAILSFTFIIYNSQLPLIIIAILHGLFGFFTSSMLLSFSLCTEHAPSYSKGTAIGFLNTMIMSGSAITQPYIGWLIDKNLSNNFSLVLSQLILFQLIALFSLILIKDTQYRKI